MPRIFKGSESTLRLLISKTGDYQALTEIKIKLYTTDIENAIEIIDGIQVCKNIAIITLAPRAFMGMEDGLINYIIDGATEDDVFHTERQSNYMLKSLSYINEDGVASQTMTIESNGEYRVTPNDGLYVDINVNVPDLNGSYDDGFNVGYEQGKTDGVNEQKSKLESINITENGTYTKEDGYNQIEVNVPDLNGSYDEGHRDGEQAGYNSGYTQGQADVAANARVLNVTENGVYQSKFSDPFFPTVTGVYDDGTDFYNYAELTNITYNTGIKVSENTKLEIWYKPRELGFINYGGIIGTAEDNTSNAFSLNTRIDKGFLGEISKLKYGYKPNGLNKWFHLELSFADGFVVDGVNYGTYQNNITNLNRYIFINDYDLKANGYFGMIKIDNITIIPTADGFLNTNTGELLEVVQNGSYTFTENVPIYGEGELYKTINVNVIPKINLQKTGLKLGFSSFTEVPEWADFEGVTDMARMFSDCTNLQTIPEMDTSNVTAMAYMFNNCSNLQTIPLLNTSNVTDMTLMFGGCFNLKTIPPIDTSNVTTMGQMFYNFSGIKTLVSLPKFNCQKVTHMGNYFSYYEDGMSALTDVGGWENLKCDWNNNYGLRACPNLTYQSCINILNGLYDFVGNGSTETRTLKVNPNFLTTVGDEISIGTNKGWTITA